MAARHSDHGMDNETLLVACLCARWCGTCRDYEPVLDALARDMGPAVNCVWVDIEDHADTLGEVDVEDFPTLLLARGDAVLFFGPITPQPATLGRLVDSALVGGLPVATDGHLAGLPAKVRGLRR
jgi:thiol-disulfide isomerase/thioredoxin